MSRLFGQRRQQKNVKSASPVWIKSEGRKITAHQFFPTPARSKRPSTKYVKSQLQCEKKQTNLGKKHLSETLEESSFQNALYAAYFVASRLNCNCFSPQDPSLSLLNPIGFFFLTPCCYLMSTCETHVKCKCFWIAPNNNVPSWEHFVACIQTRLQRKRVEYTVQKYYICINAKIFLQKEELEALLLALRHRESQIN